MAYRLTIIIPVYNEQENLPELTKRLDSYLQKAPVKLKILFVNDGSTDSSLQLLENICEDRKDLNYISFEKNCGLSAAIKAGFDYADTALTGYMDADLQTAPEDFDRLLPFVDEFDLVTGVRSNRKDTFVKKTSSVIANAIRRAFTNDGMDDTGCPLKIIKTEKAQKIPMFKGLHRFLPAMILLQKGKIKQVPVQHFPRFAGKAHFGLFNRLLGPLQDCFAYLWMKKKYINYKVDKKG